VMLIAIYKPQQAWSTIQSKHDHGGRFVGLHRSRCAPAHCAFMVFSPESMVRD